MQFTNFSHFIKSFNKTMKYNKPDKGFIKESSKD